MVYDTEFGVVFLAKGPRTASIHKDKRASIASASSATSQKSRENLREILKRKYSGILLQKRRLRGLPPSFFRELCNETMTGKVVIAHGSSVEFCEAIPIGV